MCFSLENSQTVVQHLDKAINDVTNGEMEPVKSLFQLSEEFEVCFGSSTYPNPGEAKCGITKQFNLTFHTRKSQGYWMFLSAKQKFFVRSYIASILIFDIPISRTSF